MWWWLVPALLFTFWLGAHGLDATPLWNDEWYQIRDARVSNDLYIVADHLAIQNPWHAPGYFIMLNLWARLADWHPFTLRALALFCGMLGITWTYRLGRDHISPRVGLYAALVLASSEFFVHYLHETRMYTWTVALAAYLLWIYLRVVRRRCEPSAAEWLALFGGAVVALYSHYFLLLPLGAIALYHLLFAPKNRRCWIVVGVMLLAGIAYLPWIFSALLRVINRATDREVVGLMTGSETVAWVSYLFSNGITLLLIVFALLALLAAWRWRGWARGGVLALLFFTGVVIVEILIVGALVRVFVDERTRYLIFVWPLLAVVVGIGIAEAGRLLRGERGRALSTLALGVWVVIGVRNNLYPTFTATLPGSTLTFPLQIAMRELRELHTPGDFIVSIVPDDNNYERYNNISPFYVALERLAADTRPLGIALEGTQQDLYADVMSDVGAERSYVWLSYLTEPTPAPLPEFAAVLSEQYAFCGQAGGRPDLHLRFDEYARSPVCCTPESNPRPPLIDYGNGLRLLGVDLVPEGAGLRVFASWDGADRLPPETYSVALHVLDGNETLLAQVDYGLPGETFTCPDQMMDVSQLPPGEYHVIAIVYNWQTGARLVGTLEASGEAGDALPVSAFRISEDRPVVVE